MSSSPPDENDLEKGFGTRPDEHNSADTVGTSSEPLCDGFATTTPPSDDEKEDPMREARLSETSADTKTDDAPALERDHKASEPEHHSIPAKIGTRAYRNFRWHVCSVYRRMFACIFVSNMAVVVGLAIGDRLDYQPCATAAAINILVAILARQEHVVNILFLLATGLPTSLPIAVRRRAAKVYSYGGVHSGCAVAGTCWYIAFTGLVTKAMLDNRKLLPVTVLSYVIEALLLLMVVFAYPRMRTKFHNHFEMTHRFAGWTVVAVYWAQICLLVHAQRPESPHNFGRILIHTPAFWAVAIITVCLVYPWVRLRHRNVRIERLSNHATRLHFSHTTLDRCLGVRLSTSPLIETHAFATIPATPPEQGYSAVISNAGDWTKRLIQESESRTKIWVKGAPAYGFLRVAMLFKRTVVVATGSGIGPCLSLLNANDKIDCRVLWSTISPLKTYGKGIVDAVLGADPQGVIIDTRASGRPDMVALTYQLYQESEAEAVVVISNPKLTRKVVYGMESRGVAAFGPIFDS